MSTASSLVRLQACGKPGRDPVTFAMFAASAYAYRPRASG
jgi:hypothetical protein